MIRDGGSVCMCVYNEHGCNVTNRNYLLVALMLFRYQPSRRNLDHVILLSQNPKLKTKSTVENEFFNLEASRDNILILVKVRKYLVNSQNLCQACWTSHAN